MIDLDAWLDVNHPTEGALWTLEDARGISNTGWITGTFHHDPDGPGGLDPIADAYLLDASALVPEPAALGLLAQVVAMLVHGRSRPSPRIGVSR